MMKRAEFIKNMESYYKKIYPLEKAGQRDDFIFKISINLTPSIINNHKYFYLNSDSNKDIMKFITEVVNYSYGYVNKGYININTVIRDVIDKIKTIKASPDDLLNFIKD